MWALIILSFLLELFKNLLSFLDCVNFVSLLICQPTCLILFLDKLACFEETSEWILGNNEVFRVADPAFAFYELGVVDGNLFGDLQHARVNYWTATFVSKGYIPAPLVEIQKLGINHPAPVSRKTLFLLPDEFAEFVKPVMVRVLLLV